MKKEDTKINATKETKETIIDKKIRELKIEKDSLSGKFLIRD